MEKMNKTDIIAQNKAHIKKKNVFFTMNLILAIVTMPIIAALISNCIGSDARSTTLLLALTIFTQIVFHCLLLMIKDKPKDRRRIIAVSTIYFADMILAFFTNLENYILYYVVNAIFLIALALNQFMKIERKGSKKSNLALVLIGWVFVGLAIATVAEITTEDALFCNAIVAIFSLGIAFKRILFPTFRTEKFKLLINILVKTHTIDILMCLVAFAVAFSFILPRIEPDIDNFWDGMWYCFTVITTVGFGDMTAVTNAGRLLTVILGVYGLIVVAILTSVIVNFYNEISAKEKEEELAEQKKNKKYDIDNEEYSDNTEDNKENKIDSDNDDLYEMF